MFFMGINLFFPPGNVTFQCCLDGWLSSIAFAAFNSCMFFLTNVFIAAKILPTVLRYFPVLILILRERRCSCQGETRHSVRRWLLLQPLLLRTDGASSVIAAPTPPDVKRHAAFTGQAIGQQPASPSSQINHGVLIIWAIICKCSAIMPDLQSAAVAGGGFWLLCVFCGTLCWIQSDF